MSSTRNLIDELKTITAEGTSKAVNEQMGMGGPDLPFKERQELFRSLAKSPATKKLAGEVAKALKGKMPEEATIKEREMMFSDLAHALAGEIGAMAAFSTMKESAEIKSVDEIAEETELSIEDVVALKFLGSDDTDE